MTANVVSFRKPALEIGCSACGATVDAACDCGAPYMPAGQRAAAAIAANPQMSDRAIAREIGVDHKTVGSARGATGEHSPVEARTGLDGKVRRMPTRREAIDDDDMQPATPSDRRKAFLIFSNEAMLLAKYEGPINDEVIASARATAAAWNRLVSTLENAK